MLLSARSKASATHRSFAGRIWQQSYDLLISKSTCVTSGFMLNAAIVLSVAALFSKTGALRKVQDQHSVILAFLLTLIVFIVILMATSLLARQIYILDDVEWFPERFRTLYAKGLGFIPAWNWKEVVVAFMAVSLHGNDPSESPWVTAGIVTLVVLLTAAFQIGIESLAEGCDHKTFIFSVLDSLRTSFGAGTGWAVNCVVYAFVGKELMQTRAASAIYALVATVVVGILQVKSKPAIESQKGVWPDIVVRSLTFLVVSGNFVAAFSWKSLVDAVIAKGGHSGIADYLLASCFATVCLCAIMVCFAAVDFEGLKDLGKVACAMNIGWVWGGFAMRTMTHYEETRNDGNQLSVAQVWLFTMVVIAIACLMAAILDVSFKLVEPKEKEEELPLKQ